MIFLNFLKSLILEIILKLYIFLNSLYVVLRTVTSFLFGAFNEQFSNMVTMASSAAGNIATATLSPDVSTTTLKKSSENRRVSL